MPRTCSVCQHADRPQIDAALRNGSSYRNIAARFGTSVSAVFRHGCAHLRAPPDRPAAAADERDAPQLGGLLSITVDTPLPATAPATAPAPTTTPAARPFYYHCQVVRRFVNGVLVADET